MTHADHPFADGSGIGYLKYPDPGDRSIVDAVFKEYYLPGVRDLLNNKRILSKYVKRNTEDVAGREAHILLNTGRNEGAGHVAEGGKLPIAGKQRYDRALYRTRYNYQSVLFTGQAVAASRNQRGAWIRVMDQEIRSAARDIMHEDNRIWFGDGSGVLAEVDSVVGTTIFVKNPGGFGNPGSGTQYLRPGRVVTIADPAGPTARNGGGFAAYKILSVDHAAGSITVDASHSGAAVDPGAVLDDIILVYNDIEATAAAASVLERDSSYLNEPFGLGAIVNEGNLSYSRQLGELDATALSVWNSSVIDNGGTAIAFYQDMVQQGLDLLDQASDGTAQMLMSKHGVRRQYLNLLVANKRYVNVMKLDGGHSAVEYNEIPWVVDKDCTAGRVYGLDLDTLMFFMEADYNWMDADGSILSRVPGYDAYEATLYCYHQMGTDARNRNLLIKDIIDA